MIVSATKFYNEAPSFRANIDRDVDRIKKLAKNEVLHGRSGFSISRGKWISDAVETPLNWRGTYRGYDYFVSGLVTGNCELHIGVTVFKHFNFDQGEEYGTIFNIAEATGDNLQGLYHAGIAMPFHIWSRMGSLCLIDTITGEITVQGNSTWWDNDYIIPNLPGYRAIWLIP